MKKEVKARWTAREFVQELGGSVEVLIMIKVHNLAELGFKYALKECEHGKERSSQLQIPIERYLAMSPEEKRRECEKEVQWMLTELTEIEKAQRKVEEIGKIISKEVVTGELVLPKAQERKPLKIVDKKLVQKIVTEAKKLVIDSPDMQKVLPLKELLSVAENYGLDEKWILATGYLLVEEITLRQWLVQHSHDKQDVKKIRVYHKLLEMLEEDFRKMGTPISPRDLSRFLGERLFRNRVLHEGYNPTSRESKETKEMAIGLLEFLKQH